VTIDSVTSLHSMYSDAAVYSGVREPESSAFRCYEQDFRVR